MLATLTNTCMFFHLFHTKERELYVHKVALLVNRDQNHLVHPFMWATTFPHRYFLWSPDAKIQLLDEYLKPGFVQQ